MKRKALFAEANDSSDDEDEVDIQQVLKSASPKDMMKKWTLFHYNIAESCFKVIILIVIVINMIAIIFSALPSLTAQWSWYMLIVDRICLGIFAYEAYVNICARGKEYFTNLFQIIDFMILLLSLCETCERIFIPIIGRPHGLSAIFSVFRILRGIRIFRLLKIFKRSTTGRKIFSSVALEGWNVFASLAMTVVTLHVFTMLAMSIYKDTVPEFFGSYAKAFLSMFRVMMRAQWSEIGYANHNKALVFVCIFLVVESYIIMTALTSILTVALVKGGYKENKKQLEKEVQKSKRMESDFAKKNMSVLKYLQRMDLTANNAKTREILMILEDIEKMHYIHSETEDLIKQLLEIPYECAKQHENSPSTSLPRC